MFNTLKKLYQSGEMYLIEETLDTDEERWFREVIWDKETNKAKLTDRGYWSQTSLKSPPIKVPKAFFHALRKCVVMPNILD